MSVIIEVLTPVEGEIVEVAVAESAPLIHIGTTPPDPEASPLWLDIS